MITFLEKCNGCRACELACSFHHKLNFQPSKSSIEVIPINDGYEGYEISILTETQNGRFGCDKCADRKEPACVEYCNVEVRDGLRKLLHSCWS